ncbi:replication factor C subunit 4 [Cryptosporidium sp. chipmunk genotype I]|uniref:replication factor C subunit 4 n=1 Tax=Cryptosporidium sp. chipmunk genotype I TaxID=1280935 RepID=UPI00351A1C56|nr:replication factor C subunit 4 [Cryptosporidium sp. chipmunk genotype I]
MSTQIWIEKYRPKVLDEMVGNEEVLTRLKVLAKHGNMPNLLLSGPPGTGKTTSIHCLASEMLGSKYGRAVLELNASDDRGIDVVRDKIKSFAREKIDLPEGRHKIVILDEVDSMTDSAQQALRRLMEVYSESTRFALACNQSTKIIEPIQSRCAIIRYSKLTDAQIRKRLFEIIKMENIPYVDSGIDTLVFTADGDMRIIINNLQATYHGFSIVSRDNVLKVSDIPSPEKIRNILDSCVKCNWRLAHSIVEELFAGGYSPLDIVITMRNVLKRYQLPERAILEYLKEVGRCHFVMLDGCATRLQLDKLLGQLCMISARCGLNSSQTN